MLYWLQKMKTGKAHSNYLVALSSDFHYVVKIAKNKIKYLVMLIRTTSMNYYCYNIKKIIFLFFLIRSFTLFQN